MNVGAKLTSCAGRSSSCGRRLRPEGAKCTRTQRELAKMCTLSSIDAANAATVERAAHTANIANAVVGAMSSDGLRVACGLRVQCDRAEAFKLRSTAVSSRLATACQASKLRCLPSSLQPTFSPQAREIRAARLCALWQERLPGFQGLFPAR